MDIIQPDLSHAGGLTEVKKIASMAEAYDVALAPHCPLGPIALSACLQLDATCYNAVIQEQSMGIHYNVGKEVLDYALNKEDFKFVDGYVKLPTRPASAWRSTRSWCWRRIRIPTSGRTPSGITRTAPWRSGNGNL